MAIIAAPPTTAPTQADIDRQAAERFKQAIAQTWTAMQKLFADCGRFVWANPRTTPQQALDAFGPDAVELFKLSDAYCAMVQAYTGQAVSVVPAGWNYAINPDGTVTVTQQP